MDLRFSPEDEKYRLKLRTWLEANKPAEAPPADQDADFAFRRAWQRRLYDGGWVGINWPREYGGQGATLIQQAIYGQEMTRARAPQPANGLGIGIVGPTLMEHGTETQKQRYIPKILNADEIWCQGFSEPNSGSDLASLRTRAHPGRPPALTPEDESVVVEIARTTPGHPANPSISGRCSS